MFLCKRTKCQSIKSKVYISNNTSNKYIFIQYNKETKKLFLKDQDTGMIDNSSHFFGYQKHLVEI